MIEKQSNFVTVSLENFLVHKCSIKKFSINNNETFSSSNWPLWCKVWISVLCWIKIAKQRSNPWLYAAVQHVLKFISHSIRCFIMHIQIGHFAIHSRTQIRICHLRFHGKSFKIVCLARSNVNLKIEVFTSGIARMESRAKFCINATGSAKSARGWPQLASTTFGPLKPFRGRRRGRRRRGLHVNTVISISKEIVFVCKRRASSASNDLARGRGGCRTLQTVLRLFSNSFLGGTCHSRPS